MLLIWLRNFWEFYHVYYRDHYCNLCVNFTARFAAHLAWVFLHILHKFTSQLMWVFLHCLRKNFCNLYMSIIVIFTWVFLHILHKFFYIFYASIAAISIWNFWQTLREYFGKFYTSISSSLCKFCCLLHLRKIFCKVYASFTTRYLGCLSSQQFALLV